MGKTKRKKKMTAQPAAELVDDSTPRSFIFHRGEVGKTLIDLVNDMRQVMQPYTATNLKVIKSNILKDFVHVAGPYGISHFIILSKTEVSPYLKICRLPRGPTLTFKLNEYSLMKDVIAILKRPKTVGMQFKYPCLAVLNNFSSDAIHMKLMTTVFQNMFPSLKVQKVKLNEIRRCSVFNYDKEKDCVEFRHYNIEAKPTGVSRGVKKLLKNKVPNLGTLDDISDFMTGGAYLSESEGEEPAESNVTLPQKVRGRGNMKAGQSAIRLTEMGPRLQLELLKIEDGVCDGEVLFHKFEKKTDKEVKDLKRIKEKAKKLKEKRRKEQEINVQKKEQLKEEHKQRSLAGMKRKSGEDDDVVEDDSDEDSGEEADVEKEESDDDDIEYYRKEVGEEPDQELFHDKSMKRRKMDGSSDRKYNKKPGFEKRTNSRDQKNSKMSNVKFKPKRHSKK